MPEKRRKFNPEFREGASRIERETGNRSPGWPVTWGLTRGRLEHPDRPGRPPIPDRAMQQLYAKSVADLSGSYCQDLWIKIL